MSENRNAYEQKLQAQLDVWQADINKLTAKAKLVDADTRIQLQQRLDELKKKQQAAKKKVDDLRASSGSAWNDLKKGLQEAWPSIANGFQSARDEFK